MPNFSVSPPGADCSTLNYRNRHLPGSRQLRRIDAYDKRRCGHLTIIMAIRTAPTPLLWSGDNQGRAVTTKMPRFVRSPIGAIAHLDERLVAGGARAGRAEDAP
jgi:hypothetical protein